MAGEECDDGNDVPGDRCENDCRLTYVCGDHNRDGALTVVDALRVLRYAVGDAYATPVCAVPECVPSCGGAPCR
jgi:hypothetical protein